MRATAIAYENNNGKYTSDSDVFWNEPLNQGDYISRPCTYYTFTSAPAECEI